MTRQIAHFDPYAGAVARSTYQRSGVGQLTMQQKHVAIALGAFLAGAWFATKTKTGRKLWK